MTAVTGYSTYSTVALVLQLLFLVGCIVVSYYTADDYYEDTLGVTERRSLRKKRKDGEEKSESLTLPFYREQSRGQKSGMGTRASLWSSKVKYRRGDLHPYFGFWTIMFLLTGIVVGFFATKQTGGLTFVYIANGVIAYIIFIFTAAKAGNMN